jgi:hypothetical protein
MMQRVLVVMGVLGFGTALSYPITVNNTTDFEILFKIRISSAADWGSYRIPARGTKTIDTIGYCIDGFVVRFANYPGKSTQFNNTYSGLKAQANRSSHPCRGYTVDVGFTPTDYTSELGSISLLRASNVLQPQGILTMVVR